MDAEERDALLVQGERLAWFRILGQSVQALGGEGDAERWRLEREEAIMVLRGLCEHFGDNDWNESLHLADVIDKHLGKHLHSDGR